MMVGSSGRVNFLLHVTGHVTRLHIFLLGSDGVGFCKFSKFFYLGKVGIGLSLKIFLIFDFLIFDFAPVGLVLGGVLEIFKILLPRLGSDRVSRFFSFLIFSILIF